MKKEIIPFKLGMEYENWAYAPLDLSIWTIINIVGTGLNKFLNKTTDETELFFSLDILKAVIIKFKDKSMQFFNGMISLCASGTGGLKHLFCIEEFAQFEVEIKCIYKNKDVFVIYSKKNLIKRLIKEILWKKAHKKAYINLQAL